MKKVLKKSYLILSMLFAFLVFVNCQSEDLNKGNNSLDEVNSIIKKVNKDNVINISKNSEVYKYTIHDGFEEAFNIKAAPGDILCEGSGISFARCVKKNLDSGKIMKLYRDGNTYYAEEM
ncbi:hypothetical protein SAMN04489761_4637 [Tenacibaculum sp. MAR_2009_124]|uniref:hypothetical protein n=1 Tax=Tenacibaculum sp. MAR_2009_124 TaxID=1250059 RepID=UPI0008962CE2|nr:hypothetical protein [Tenacibaculum sp. MAR_2009_124]SED21149.1 hypothetical protein SAMN04489761_4637 [Tenacibaculum sp. MAR_2009_124]